MNKMNNMLIRSTMNEYGLKQWQVAEILGINEESLSRKMRHEIPLDEQRRVVILIKGSLADEEYIKKIINDRLDMLWAEYGNYSFFGDLLKEYANQKCKGDESK